MVQDPLIFLTVYGPSLFAIAAFALALWLSRPKRD